MTDDSTPRAATRSRGVIRMGLLGALAFIVSTLGLAACKSLDESELERRMLNLPKNRASKEHGLLRHEATARLGTEAVPVEFVYLKAGEPRADRGPIVLVHATPSSLFAWNGVIFGEALRAPSFEGLATDHEVYAVDVIGHGITRGEVPQYGFQVCADYVSAFLRELDLSDVTLVGNSYGGEFAWRAALDSPDRVSRVVLMSPSGYERRDDEWLPEEEAMREHSLAYLGYLLNSEDRIRGALEPHYRGGVHADRVTEIYLSVANRNNWYAMVDLARDENGDRSTDLTRMLQPTLLLWGAEDVAYPIDRFARQFERDIPNATLELVPDCGHYPHEEHPVEFVTRLRAWLDRQ